MKAVQLSAGELIFFSDSAATKSLLDASYCIIADGFTILSWTRKSWGFGIGACWANAENDTSSEKSRNVRSIERLLSELVFTTQRLECGEVYSRNCPSAESSL